jgi:hypothetical protein
MNLGVIYYVRDTCACFAQHKMDEDESLYVAWQPTCEDQGTNNEIVSYKCADIEKEDEIVRESKEFSGRARDGGIRKPPVFTSLNDSKQKYGLNRLL